MSYERMGTTEKRLEEEIRALLEQAERVDVEEDGAYGQGRRGDELPDELSRRESRLQKIRQAKAGLEREAQERAVAQAAEASAKGAERERQAAEKGKRPRA